MKCCVKATLVSLQRPLLSGAAHGGCTCVGPASGVLRRLTLGFVRRVAPLPKGWWQERGVLLCMVVIACPPVHLDLLAKCPSVWRALGGPGELAGEAGLSLGVLSGWRGMDGQWWGLSLFTFVGLLQDTYLR